MQLGHVLLGTSSNKTTQATSRLDWDRKSCSLQRVFILDVSKKHFCCLRTSAEAILEPLKAHFLFVASDSISGEASKLPPKEKKLLDGEALEGKG
jgi:hypothetical protein